ncbi:MAG: beta-galactosidase [Kiritimatiellaeota bacterium]|nr:beta-galactosidase [Kiritimatiellota bacterium]
MCAKAEYYRTGHIAILVTLFASLALSLVSYAEESLVLDRFSGLKKLSFGPGAAFRTHYDGRHWWFVTPDGGAFLSLGVCVVNPTGDTERDTNRQPYRENVLAKHGSVEAWARITANRLHAWGLNTLGNWSGSELRGAFPYTKELSVSSGLWGKLGAGGLRGNKTVPDFFSPEVQAHIRKRAAAAEATANDPYLIGYYLDNELPWAKDWRLGPDLFPGYMALPPEAPGKQRLVEFFRERYQTVDRFNAVWSTNLKDWNELASRQKLISWGPAQAQRDREAFVLLVAREYFKTAVEAIRAKDPHHLILGCRFLWAIVPWPVVQACGEYCDVVSINYYEAGVLGKLALWLTTSMRVRTDLTFRPFYDLARKPLLITEFSFRAKDSGLPNTYPPPSVIQPRVSNQMARAAKFEHCATIWMSQPYFLGYHWFQYMDQPKGGRSGDGENDNFGLVNIQNDPYRALVERLATVNRRVWTLHTTPAPSP